MAPHEDDTVLKEGGREVQVRKVFYRFALPIDIDEQGLDVFSIQVQVLF